MSEMVDRPKTWQEVELKRFGVFAFFIASMMAASLGAAGDMILSAFGGLVGYGIATGLHLLWGERTRPKNTVWWWLIGLAWIIYLWVISTDMGNEGLWGLLVGLPLAAGITLFSRHDQSLTPSFFIAGAVIAALFRGPRTSGGVVGVGERPSGLVEADAVWIALAVLLGVIAALLEHERLMRRTGPGTPVPWTVIRIAFIGLWTLVILELRGDVQWGRLFMLLGANLEGQGGQMLLVGILLVALVVAAVALRPGRPQAPRTPPPRFR